MSDNKYIVKIGIEVHVQLGTKKKMFCNCENKYGETPNTLICPICTGHPGTMPILSHEVIIKAITAGLLFNCKISKFSRFDRKNYFYPDMPKNNQITQLRYPICTGGEILIGGSSIHGDIISDKIIKLNRVHLEEDVAKINYIDNKVCLDFNRSGIPLIEIVTEPDISSADEAYLYVTTLRKILHYTGVSNCDMEKGQMRCDVNLSLNDFENSKSGVRLEIKNLNSFRSIYKSIQYEIDRQKNILNKGDKLKQATLGWDDDKLETYQMRIKETACGYRYLPEPDILPLILSDEYIRKIESEMIEHPETVKNRIKKEYGITEYDASLITNSKKLTEYFEESAKYTTQYKMLANWIITNFMKELNTNKINIENVVLSPENMSKLINLISLHTISINAAKKIFSNIFKTNEDPNIFVKDSNFIKITNDEEIKFFILEVINNNKKQVDQYLNGNESIFKYLIGQVMKISNGRIQPEDIIRLLTSELNIIKNRK